MRRSSQDDGLDLGWEDIQPLDDPEGDLEGDIRALQKLINAGQWALEGSMGRAMMEAIEAGYCALGLKPARDAYGNSIPSRYEVQPGTKGSEEFVQEHSPLGKVLDTYKGDEAPGQTTFPEEWTSSVENPQEGEFFLMYFVYQDDPVGDWLPIEILRRSEPGSVTFQVEGNPDYMDTVPLRDWEDWISQDLIQEIDVPDTFPDEWKTSRVFKDVAEKIGNGYCPVCQHPKTKALYVPRNAEHSPYWPPLGLCRDCLTTHLDNLEAQIGQKIGAYDDYDEFGARNLWQPGDKAFFEYHCNQAHNSEHAQWWYRSRQPVTVLSGPSEEDMWGTAKERGEGGNPYFYKVRWDDGFEGDVFEDELLVDPRFYDQSGNFCPPPQGDIDRYLIPPQSKVATNCAYCDEDAVSGLVHGEKMIPVCRSHWGQGLKRIPNGKPDSVRQL